MSVRIVPDDVRRRQAEASDPLSSAWVAANAGSGKTHVLAQRVIRLLLDGVDPSHILCITFTKAAAANMANRVFDTLRAWTALDDAALDAALHGVGAIRGAPELSTPVDADAAPVRRHGEADSRAALRERARRLFALALETPGGLKVQTIHAFCTNLLHLFPFEANVAHRFNVMDDAAGAQLVDRVVLEVLLDAAAEPDGALGRALAAVVADAADVTVRAAIGDALDKRDAIMRWVESAGGVPEAVAELSTALGVAPGDTLDALDKAVIAGACAELSNWADIAAILASGQKTDIEQGRRFASLATLDGEALRDCYLSIFFTGAMTPRASIVTKPIRTAHPGLAGALLEEQERLCRLVEARCAVVARDRTAALLTLAHAVIARYRDRKARRGLLDYDDLIDKALDLLQDEAAAWVHYKLDRGIHHVLIDEAQDTSPKQWEIVRALVAEFFAGLGAHERRRTIFAVGDEKQSIFSFQGAAPRQFEAMRTTFETLSRGVGRDFRKVAFQHSFRSGANVLGAVDLVFESAALHASLTSDRDGMQPHIALPDAAPGLVEIWEPEQPDAREPVEGWDAPFDVASETSPAVKLARRIAGTVATWREQGTRAGEVMVLVRRRGPLFEAIIRALKNAQIPVAGADRLVLTDHIAVMDLLALADVLLLPQDDLALAAVLKSPLFGLSEDELFALAADRGRQSLSDALDAIPGTPFAQARARLRRYRDLAEHLPVFAFFARVLGPEGGRRRFLARLGHEAADALDEFLNRALDYERQETQSLQGFVAWMRAAQAEVKRDLETGRDEVRVMTVHGAKGLEAPVVILAESTTPPKGWHGPTILALEPGAEHRPPPLVWAGARANDCAAMTAARDAAEAENINEYRRLLYVALTRAQRRLVVCGTDRAPGRDGTPSRPDGCWYDLVRDALAPQLIETKSDFGDYPVQRFARAQAAAGSEAPAAPAAEPTRNPPPAWLGIAAAESVGAAPLAPSRRPGQRKDSIVNGLGRARAIARGLAVHRLLQALPDIATERRAEAALAYLTRRGDMDPQEARELALKVLELLDDSRFAGLFGTAGRAEVPIVGRFGARTVTIGVVDRLVIENKSIMIADFKTGGPPPQSLAEARARHPEHLSQLGAYTAVLRKLYPEHCIKAALFWVDGPILMEVPAADLDRAFADFVAAAGALEAP